MNRETSTAKYGIPVLCAILIAAAFVRFIGLGSLPLWMDEVSSVWFSDQTYGYLWDVVPRFENHPSPYYMVLKAWRSIAGSSEFALRTPTVIAGLGAVSCCSSPAGRSVVHWRRSAQ